MNNFEELNKHVFVTKLAGFEHTKYIQQNQIKRKINNSDIPLVQGKNIRDGHFVNKYDWYIQKEISDKLSRSKLNKICILIPYVGSNLGEVGIFYHNEDCHLASNVAKIELIDDYFDIEYLKYYLQSKIGQSYLFQSKQGSAQPNITMEAIRKTKIINYDKKRQVFIAKILKSIDKKIELNSKINNELEAMVKTIYDYWFLQFEFPNEEGKPYKSSGGKMVWNDELKREIPEGWINGHLKEYIKNQKAGDWGKENAINNYQKEVTCIRGADFSSITSFEKMDMPRRFILEKNSFKLLSVYDLLIEISGGSPIQSTGRICYINDAVLKRFSTKLITSNFCKAISLTDNNYFYWFYMLWKTLYINNVFFNYESKTTGIKNLLFDIMCEKYPICKPPIQIIRLYNQQVTPYFNKIQQNIIENQELTSLRDFLLPLLMNGQVGFKEDKAEG